MTEREQRAFDALVEAWDRFIELPIEHADDIPEFRAGIHALQRHILARPTRRELNR